MSDIAPITRREMFLNALSDETQETPEPITREEIFLQKAAESGGGSGISEPIVIWEGTAQYNADIELSDDVDISMKNVLIFEFGKVTEGIKQSFITAGLVFSGSKFCIGLQGQNASWAQLQYDSDNHKIHFLNDSGYGSGTITKIYKL